MTAPDPLELSKFINFQTPYTINNSLDLVKKIKEKMLPENAKLVSFDVRSLFTSIHIYELKCIFWVRYIDDMFCLRTGTERQLTLFLQLINLLNRKIQFTVEIKNKQSINVLDNPLTLKITPFFFIFTEDLLLQTP